MRIEEREGRKQKAEKTKSLRFSCLLPCAYCLLFFEIRNPKSAFRNHPAKGFLNERLSSTGTTRLKLKRNFLKCPKT